MECATTGNREADPDRGNLRVEAMVGMDEQATAEQEFQWSESLVRRPFEAIRLHSRPFFEWPFRGRECSDPGCVKGVRTNRPYRCHRFAFRRGLHGLCGEVARRADGEH